MPKTSLYKRILLWSVPVLALTLSLFLLFRPRAELVDIVQIDTGPMLVTIDEEGETRTREVFTISAPVTGRLLRPLLKVGDNVVAGETVVAEIEPSDPAFLDPRSLAESEAARNAAAAALDLATAELKRVEAERDFAFAEVERARQLYQKGTVPKQRVDDAERAAQATEAAVDAATANLSVQVFELNRAEARLITPAQVSSNRQPCECISLKSPVTGRVLRVLLKSETVVAPGVALLELGDPQDLEVIADLISVDAVKIAPGQRAIIEQWGGEQPLEARVRVVEPLAFTKVSALGIEEQRVNVIMDLVDPPDQRPTLGHGYRVNVRIVVWEGEDVLTVPLTALFRRDSGWAIFVDQDGAAVIRNVDIGRTQGLDVEVLSGLEAGERIVRHPSDRLTDGVRIRYRS